MTRLTLSLLTLALASIVTADFCEDFESGTAGSFWTGNPLDQAGQWRVVPSSELRREVPDLPPQPSGSHLAYVSQLDYSSVEYVHGRLVSTAALQFPAGSFISFRYWIRSQYEASSALDVRFVIGTAEQPTPFLDLSAKSGPTNDQWRTAAAQIPATNSSVKISIFGGRGLDPLDQVVIDDITVHGPAGLDHQCGGPTPVTTTAEPTTTTAEPTTTTAEPTTTTAEPTTTTAEPTTTTAEPTTTTAEPTTTTTEPTTTTAEPTTTTPEPTTTTPKPTTTEPTTTTPIPTTTTRAPTSTAAPAPTTQDPNLRCVCSLGTHNYYSLDHVYILVSLPPLPSYGCGHDAERLCEEECRTTKDVLEAEGSWTAEVNGARLGDLACAAWGQDETHGVTAGMYHNVCELETKHSASFEPHLCCSNGVYERCRRDMARNRLVRDRP